MPGMDRSVMSRSGRMLEMSIIASIADGIQVQSSGRSQFSKLAR